MPKNDQTYGRHVASAQEQAIGISDLEEADGPPAKTKRLKKRKKVKHNSPYKAAY